jgi:hypothetical protein
MQFFFYDRHLYGSVDYLNQWNGPYLRTKINKILKFYAHFRYLFLPWLLCSRLRLCRSLFCALFFIKLMTGFTVKRDVS